MKRLNIGFCGKTDIRSKLNIDGYFTTTDTTSWISGYGSTQHKVDSSCWTIIFFEDGTLVSLRASYFDPTEYTESTERYFREISKDSTNDFHAVSGGAGWGAYKLIGDTIVAQTIDFRPFKLGFDRWEWSEVIYLILDRNHVEVIGGHLIVGKTIINHSPNKHDHNILPARFTPFQPLPSSDCWLKQQEWMQCGKQSR